jgi:hypothetical protein
MQAANELVLQRGEQLPEKRYEELAGVLDASYSFAAQEELLADGRFFRSTRGGLLRVLGGICATAREKRRQEFHIALQGGRITLAHLRESFFTRLGRDPKTGEYTWKTLLSPGTFASEVLAINIEALFPGPRRERDQEIDRMETELANLERFRRVYEHVDYDPRRLHEEKLRRFSLPRQRELLATSADYREFYRRVRELDYAAMVWDNLRRQHEESTRDAPSPARQRRLEQERRMIEAASKAEALRHQRAVVWLRLRDHLMAFDWNEAIKTTKEMERLGMGEYGKLRSQIEDLVTRDLSCDVLRGWADAALMKWGMGRVQGMFGRLAGVTPDPKKSLLELAAASYRDPSRIAEAWYANANPFADGVTAAAMNVVENAAQECIKEELRQRSKLSDADAAKLAQLTLDLAKAFCDGFVAQMAGAAEAGATKLPPDAESLRSELLARLGDLDDHPLRRAVSDVAEAVRRVEGAPAGSRAEAEAELARAAGELLELVRVVDGARRQEDLERSLSETVINLSRGEAEEAARRLRKEIEGLHRRTFENLVVDYELTRSRDEVDLAVRTYLGQRQRIAAGDDAGLPAGTDPDAAAALLRRVDLKRLLALKSSGMLSATHEKAIDRARRTVTHAVREKVVLDHAQDVVAVIITGTGGDPANAEYKRLGSDQDFTILARDSAAENAIKRDFDAEFEKRVGAPPDAWTVECFQDPESKLHASSPPAVDAIYARLKGEISQGERYLVLGTLKLIRYIDQKVGCGYVVRGGKLVRMADTDFEGLFGKLEFTAGDGFDILVDNIAFINKYRAHHGDSPSELLSHIAKYDIRVLAGMIAATPEGRRRLNELTRADIERAGGMHSAFVEIAATVPGLEYVQGDAAKRYYQAARKLKLGASPAEALGLSQRADESATAFQTRVDARCAELLATGTSLRRAAFQPVADARTAYRQELLDRFEEHDRAGRDAAAAVVGRERDTRDLSAAFQLRNLDPEQRAALAATGGRGMDAARTMVQLGELLARTDRDRDWAKGAAGRVACPVY